MVVEWAPQPGCPKVAHYHLQWKLVSDGEWMDTAASKKIAATVVTKGNLRPDAPYQFRVRACSKQSNEWGAWCQPSVPLAPAAEPRAENDDALSTISEEASDVASAVTSKTTPAAAAAAPPGGAAAKPPEPSATAPKPPSPPASGQSLAMDVVKGLLKDQRQALEAQSAQELTDKEAQLQGELEAARAELDNWKSQFMEAASTSLQQVVEAKEATRAEVLAELEAETKAVEAMKAEASEAVERIRAAEKVAEEARAEAKRYIDRFEFAKAEAKAETDREAEAKLNLVMRNASLEMRDKVKFVEQQTEATVKRAVDEAVKQADAKAEVARRNERHALEVAHEKQLQVIKDSVGASTKHRINEIQAAQEERVEAAVRQALAEAREAAARAERTAVQAAVAEAVEETETRMMARHGVLEQQLVGAKKDLEARTAEMYSEEQVLALVHRAKEEGRAQQEKVVRETMERAEEKVALERQRALESVSDAIRKSVRERERELLANNGQGLQELLDKELKDATQLVKSTGPAEALTTYNNDFEERALKKTQPEQALKKPTYQLDDDDLPILPRRPAEGLDKKPPLPTANGVPGRDDDNESMVAPPPPNLQEALEMGAKLAGGRDLDLDSDVGGLAAQSNPEVRHALEKVHELENQLRTISAADLGANGLGDKGKGGGLKEGGAELQAARDKAMRKMLQGLEANDASTKTRTDPGMLALQLHTIITRETKSPGDAAQLAQELKGVQEQPEAAEAQLAWLKAEAKCARLAAAPEAEAPIPEGASSLRAAGTQAVEAGPLDLPITPIAAAEDAFSIAVDWLPPASKAAVRYHLQWRSDEDSSWMSTTASENINVPCCTKGHLKTQLGYQFRVRAGDKAGRWGAWSEPTERTAPNVLLNDLPSRPQVRGLSKGRIEARWSEPEGAATIAGYELQWRTCDGKWGEPGSSLECDAATATTPNLTFGTHYTFRVRASVERRRGTAWTDWSPPSAPILAAGSSAAAAAKKAIGRGS